MMPEKRIPAVDFWELEALNEAGAEAIKEGVVWRRGYVKGHGLYLDDVNFVSGLVTVLLPDGTRRPVRHIPQEDIDEADGFLQKVDEANVKLKERIRFLAKRYGALPHQIDVLTGAILVLEGEVAEPVDGQSATLELPMVKAELDG